MGKVVLITGCSSGIGRATTKRLADHGHTVYATARRLESVEDLAGPRCRTLALDVTDEASMRAAVARVEGEHGALDVLVNNAGYGQDGPVEEVALADVRRQFETNVFGLVALTQMALPAMRARGSGTIVNLSSMVIERAIDARSPRARYPVTAGARVMLGVRRALPDRAWDALMRAQFPSPQAATGRQPS